MMKFLEIFRHNLVCKSISYFAHFFGQIHGSGAFAFLAFYAVLSVVWRQVEQPGLVP